MYELEQLGEHTWTIESPARMGVVADGQSVWLIDSGNDSDAARKVLRILDARGWTLAGVLNTHSNADHVGGNALLATRTGCPCYTTPLEGAFVTFPVLEPSFLYGGFPPGPLRNKFLMAKSSPSRPLAEATLPAGLTVLPLAGHFFDMVGFGTGDGVWFLADSLTGASIIEKYHVNFIYDVAAYLTTLDRIDGLEGTWFVPSHGERVRDVRPLTAINRRNVESLADWLVERLATPATTEILLAELFDRFGLTMDWNQHVLIGSTLRSYLAWLMDAGRVTAAFEANRLVWRAV